jgi:hypothetical protein
VTGEQSELLFVFGYLAMRTRSTLVSASGT